MRRRQETPWSSHDWPLFGNYARAASFANWRPHGTGDWLLIYTLGGSGRVTTPSGSFSTQPGDAILYAPGDFQDYRTDPRAGKWQLLWSHFVALPVWAPWLRWPQGREGVRRLHLGGRDLRSRFVAALTRALRFSRGSLPGDFAVNALEEALLWAALAGVDESHGRRDPRIRKGMDYLAGKLKEPFRLETVARHCGLSVSRFAHLFKETAGISPQKFFEQQRLRQAGELLGLSSLGIAEIAAEVGYEDPFYFSNRFRKQMGKSPSQWRRDRSQKKSAAR
jgi:AraC family transcriptional regulator of arabinose operon